MWYQFQYASGGNPYIAKTEPERDRITRKHEELGESITELKPGFYMIDDAGPAIQRPNRDQLQPQNK